jgi:hypothetical protein
MIQNYLSGAGILMRLSVLVHVTLFMIVFEYYHIDTNLSSLWVHLIFSLNCTKGVIQNSIISKTTVFI